MKVIYGEIDKRKHQTSRLKSLVFLFPKTVAARQGLEPQYLGPKPSVLPLDDRAISIYLALSFITQNYY